MHIQTNTDLNKVGDRIILALDDVTLEKATELAEKVGPLAYALKAHDLCDRHGVERVAKALKGAGAQRFWADYKLHDIPQTVAHRAKKLAICGADLITVHASGGTEMMQRARESEAEIIAVTLLTSFSVEQLQRTFGYAWTPTELVLRWAHLASDAGVTSIVCSPKEVTEILARFPNMEPITPGVRSPGKDHGDQRRVDTPVNALRNGAARVVIGRQVTLADDPVAAFHELVNEITLGMLPQPIDEDATHIPS